MPIRLLPILWIVYVSFAPTVYAQTGTAAASDPTASSSSPQTMAATSSAAQPIPSRATSTTATPAVATTSSQSTPMPRPVAAVPSAIPSGSAAAQAAPVATTTSPAVDDEQGSALPWWLLWAAVAFLALLPFGYFVAKALKGEKTQKSPAPDKKGGQCFDIKQMLDQKLRQLTDVRGQLEEKLKGAAKEQLRDSLTGTATGDLLAQADKFEQEYEQLKKLFEQCMWEHGGTTWRGQVIENSLTDTEVLKKAKILDSRLMGMWTVHRVEVDASKIKEFAKHIADGPWYMHFWESGKNDMKIVFKDKIFDIKHSDRSSWNEAIAYGVSIGIPKEQLDFPIK